MYRERGYTGTGLDMLEQVQRQDSRAQRNVLYPMHVITWRREHCQFMCSYKEISLAQVVQVKTERYARSILYR